MAKVSRAVSLADQCGATLVELMVALILLSIALVGMGAAMPYGAYPVVAGGFQTTATLLSQQGIDLARNTLYANLSTLSTGGNATCRHEVPPRLPLWSISDSAWQLFGT